MYKCVCRDVCGCYAQGGEAILRVDRTPDSLKLWLAIVLRMILCLEAPVFSLFLGSGMCE